MKKLNKKGEENESIINNKIIIYVLILIIILVLSFLIMNIMLESREKESDIICMTAIEYSNSKNLPTEFQKCPILNTNANNENEIYEIINRCKLRLKDLNPNNLLKPYLTLNELYSKNDKTLIYNCAELKINKDINFLEFLNKKYNNYIYLTYLSNNIAVNSIYEPECQKMENEIKNTFLKKGEYVIYKFMINLDKYTSNTDLANKLIGSNERVCSNSYVSLSGFEQNGQLFLIYQTDPQNNKNYKEGILIMKRDYDFSDDVLMFYTQEEITKSIKLNSK